MAAKPSTIRIAAHKSAVLLWGGRFPQAYAYPAARRATRDVRRRRCPLARQRAELFAHLHNTTSQSHLPELGKRLANQATREAVAEHFPDPRVRKAIAVEVALIDHDDQLLGAVERYVTRRAKAQEVQPFARLPSGPGSGQSLAVVLLSEIQASSQFPRGQDFVSACRLMKGAKESNGKRLGTSGKKIGTVH
jgi:hypothetical protein